MTSSRKKNIVPCVTGSMGIPASARAVDGKQARIAAAATDPATRRLFLDNIARIIPMGRLGEESHLGVSNRIATGWGAAVLAAGLAFGVRYGTGVRSTGARLGYATRRGLAGVQRRGERGPLFAAGADQSHECRAAEGCVAVRHRRERQSANQPADRGAGAVRVHVFREGDRAGCGNGASAVDVRLQRGESRQDDRGSVAAVARPGVLDGREERTHFRRRA